MKLEEFEKILISVGVKEQPLTAEDVIKQIGG